MWSTDVKLRHKAINFVSAGSLAGTLPDEPRSNESTPNESTPGDTAPKQEEPIAEAVARSTSAMARMQLEPAVETPSSPTSDPLFFVDTTGSSAQGISKLPPPVVRSASPTPSNSSEEVVLFRGRNNVRTVTDSLQPSGINSRASAQSGSKSPVKNTSQKPAGALGITANAEPRGASARRSKTHKGRRQVNSEPDDEAIADYLENIRAQEFDEEGEPLAETVYETSTFSQRTLGLMDSDERSDDRDQSNGRSFAKDTPHNNDWDSPQLQDFDNLSTSPEPLANIDRILRKRERSSGTQYLVVYENSNEDEARWLPITRMTQTGDQQLIAAFEEAVANVKIGNEADDSESWSDASEEDDDSDDDDEEEDFEDEKDLIQRRIDRMSDEKLARLLAKQEELGMGSDELMLFNDDEEDDDDLEIDDFEFQDFAARPKGAKHQKPKSKKGRDNFPSASLMADVLEQDPYNGFDIMDFERPSLKKKKKKGRAAQLTFELSDEELSAQLEGAWEADRSKKRLRKKEREELRAQGLLGKKNKFKPDLSAKYNEGMTFIQIKEEIKVFLNSPSQSRPFPPMNKHDRAAIHQLAAALGLSSRSVGSGNSRFLTITKTARTRGFDEISFAKITSRYHNRFLPRMDKAGGGRKGTGFGGGAGGKYAGVSYRDGDVVGGSAPEIGSENKGRAMLEKMGWSSGTALGALNNKGILQPVTHVVKTTKTGLG